jgi:hypothetical protein
MADRSPQNINALYFIGTNSVAGKRIVPNKNDSSNDRVFGLEPESKGPPSIAGSEKSDLGQLKGKKQYFSSSS